MLAADAIPLLKKACGKPFRELLAGHPADLITNKGHAGQLLERYIGLSLGNTLIDFEDGELKTNKTAANGTPLETIAVTQISTVIDQLIGKPCTPFRQSSVYKKLENLVVVPVVKEGDCGSWYLLDVYQIDMRKDPVLFERFEHDYHTICHGLRERVEAGEFIGTTSGHYLQVRTKDSKPYHPIRSKIYQRSISSKNYAFYLQKSFVRDILTGQI